MNMPATRETAFDAIVRVARDAKLPLIISDPEFVQRGALVAVDIETGKAASKILAQVLRGELSTADCLRQSMAWQPVAARWPRRSAY